MTRWLVRLVRIDWQGFGHTRHWLSGLAHWDWCLKESMNLLKLNPTQRLKVGYLLWRQEDDDAHR